MMGLQVVKGSFTAILSRTNTEKDTTHNELWLDFINKIKYIAANPKYKGIELLVDANEDP